MSLSLINKKLDTRHFYDPHRLETFADDFSVKAIPALFVTTPLLNFNRYNLVTNDFFVYLAETDPELLSLLSYGSKVGNTGRVNTSPFIKLLSNRFDGFTTKATTSQPREVGETFYGYKQYLPGPYVNSVTGDTITVEYTETGNMDVLKLHKAWADYIEGISRGTIRPTGHARANRYLDFTSSIYLFNLAEDGETIIFFEKLTGCAPISVPYDVFSSKASNDREIVKYSIDYVYSHKDDYNPRNLLTFNALARFKAGSLLSMTRTALNYYNMGAITEKVDLLNTVDMYSHPDMLKAANPVVIQSKDANGKLVFKLKYTAPNT